MTQRKSRTGTTKSTANRAFPAGDLAKATGTDNEQLQLQRLQSVLNTIWLTDARDENAGRKAIAAVLASLEKIAPLDELEGMLAAQMVATHNTAVDCMRLAMLPEQTYEGRQDNLKHAVKFLNLYTRQLEALDKHRGHGQQNVTVDNVQVHAGGQAIVGNVNTKDRNNAKTKPAGIEHKPAPVMPKLSTKAPADAERKTS